MTVTTTTAAMVEIDVPIAASGPVAAWQEASVDAPFNGPRVTALLVNVGDRVRKGAVLATFDTSALLAAQAQAKAQVDKAAAAARLAALNRSRARDLDGTGAMSDQDMQQIIAAADSAEADLAAARAALAATSVPLREAVIRAPDDGIVASRTATLGASAVAGQEMFRLIRQARLEWRAQLPSALAAGLQAGTLAQVEIADGSVIEGRVRMLAPGADPQSHLLTVFVDLASNTTARAGVYAGGSFAGKTRRIAAVPAESLVIRDARQYVFIVEHAGAIDIVHRRIVRTAGTSDGLVGIADGLQGGETVVRSGAGLLDDGDIVKVVSRQPGSSPVAKRASK
jgi:RND family efflux transporter MFP subunit